MRAIPLSTLAAVTVFAGCTSSSVGGPCSLDDPCDEGVCNLSGPGEPTCVDKDDDLDGDGLPNSRDFCNQQAGGEFDEDGDGVGDDCDRCPIARPAASPDSDDDMVDSPCDPEPSMPGNKIVLFEAFNKEPPASWRREGAWEFRGGEAVYVSGDPNALATLTAPVPVSSQHAAVIASYRADGIAAGANQSRAGVTLIDRRPAGMTSMSCSGTRTGTDDALVADSDLGGSSRPFANLFDPAGLYRVAQRLEGAVNACAIVANAQSGAVQQATGGQAPTEAGLAARGANVQFQYVIVVQRPN